MLKPKLFSILKHKDKELSREQLTKDIISGVIVAVIALPLSVALAISSGVSPEKGLITAIIAGFLISFLGGSRVQIGGPTGAFVIIVYGIIETYGIKGLTIATIMAGIILVILGLLRFGDMIKYIPYTITTGFTAGIAVVLFSTQVKDLLGLKIDKVPSEFIHKWSVYISHISTTQWQTLLIGLLSIIIIVYWPKFNKTIPGSLVALVIATVLVKFLKLPVETIGDRFGEISSRIPAPALEIVDMNTVIMLIKPAITIALLAGIESLLSAVVADGMIGKKHNSNMELIAQGIANVASALFGGIPATGAIARTAANIKNGAKTPISGVVHAITLLLIMVLFMPLAKLIPMTTLAAILTVVAYNMSDIDAFRALLKAPKSDITVLLITFIFTVVFDLVIAIGVGMVVTMFLFIRRMSEHTKIYRASNIDNNEDGYDFQDRILIYEIKGPLFFGASQDFMDVMREVNSTADVLILKMGHVPIMDATAYDALLQIYERCKKSNILLMFSEIGEQPMKVMDRMGLVRLLGNKSFYPSLEAALNDAKKMVLIKEEQTA
jgi:SulP family sulfate permease